MGKTTGFMEYERELPSMRPVDARIKDYQELYEQFAVEKIEQQAARCMNCGVPFCHIGCPLGNIIPEFNDLVYRGKWKEALEMMMATNNFPEFTGRLCPAPCEESCVLGINEPPVTIELIEKSIIEQAFELGLVQPCPPEMRTGKTVAVVGSGPAGLAAAQQLNRAGHTATVFERADRIGGLLRYGIPDFKLEKSVLDRRVHLLEQEGIVFKPGTPVGTDKFSASQLVSDFNAVVLTCGATEARDLPIPGRELEGVHFAMEFLGRQNQQLAGDEVVDLISARDKDVIVIGGGDTGSDCIGTSCRHGARSVTNFELLPMPPVERPANQPWPFWPMKLRVSSSHKEGCDRFFSILTKEFSGQDGKVAALKTVNVEFRPQPGGGQPKLIEIPGTEYFWKADLVLLAMGFVGPEKMNVIKDLNLEQDPHGNVKTDENYMTSKPGVFSAGDMRRGQSLIVWAISEGRECARCVDIHLMGESYLPTKGRHDLPVFR